MNELTEAQRDVIGALRVFECLWVAETVAGCWQRGERAYIDARLDVPGKIRKAVNKINKEVCP